MVPTTSKTQLCKFTAPVPHLAVYTGICEAQLSHGRERLPPSPGFPALPNSAACPSPISVAIDSTPASERKFEGQGGSAAAQFPSISEVPLEPRVSASARGPDEPQIASQKSRVALSLSRFLRRGCGNASVLASLSPKCHSAMGGRVQPLGREPLSQPQPKRIANFFQIKVDIPPECRIYPIDSEDEENECTSGVRGTVKEIICPWESITKQDQAG